MMKEKRTAQQEIWLWMQSFWEAGRALGLYILMPALCMSVGYVFWHADMTAVEFFSYGGNFYTAVGMALTLYMLYRHSRKKGRRFFEDATLYLDRMEWRKALAFFAFGLASAVTLSAALALLPRWGVMNRYSEASQTMFLGRDILFTVVTMVVTAPVVEEVVFRGYILNAMLENFGEKQAMIAASLLFALCHGTFLWVLYTFVMGLILAWTSIREDNIGYGILLHIGFNLPSALIWLIRSVPGGESFFFAGKGLTFAYGMIGALSVVLLVRWYRGR